MSEEAELPMEVDVQTVNAMQQQNGQFILLDVREQNEYDIAKIDGSLPMPRVSWGCGLKNLSRSE